MPEFTRRRAALALSLMLAGLSCAAPAAAAAPMQIEGLSFDGTARVADTNLQLNGVGKRAAFIYKVYAAGLYLPRPTHNAADAVNQPGPKRLQMRMLMDGPADEFAKAFDKGIAKSLTPEQLQAMKDRTEAFDRILRDLGDLHTGDLVNLDFVPSRGLVLTFNGKVRGNPVPGVDLYNALLLIFLGDRPLDKALKVGLLGGRVE